MSRLFSFSSTYSAQRKFASNHTPPARYVYIVCIALLVQIIVMSSVYVSIHVVLRVCYTLYMYSKLLLMGWMWVAIRYLEGEREVWANKSHWGKSNMYLMHPKYL